MVSNVSAHSFLCGYFKLSAGYDLDEICARTYSIGGRQDVRWEKQVLNGDYSKHWCMELDKYPGVRKDYRYWCQSYYESYVESLLDAGDDMALRKDLYRHTSHLVMTLECTCEFEEISFPFVVKRLHLFVFTKNIAIFAIELDEPNVSPDAMITGHKILRDVESYDGISADGAYLKSLAPLLDLCGKDGKAGRYADLMESGAKLKLFQIVSTTDISDERIYEFGTLIRTGAVSDISDYDCPSRQYYDSIIRTNMLSVYNNWKALALLDTFTVLGVDFTDSFFVWVSYFRMIYIHSLYQKLLLVNLDKDFRFPKDSSKPISLEDEMKELEMYYAFPTISYNFLPQLIYEKINVGLGLQAERDQLHKYIEQESRRQERVSEKKLNRLITTLTVFTMGSVLFDVTSLVSSMLGLDIPSCGFNMVAWVAIAFVIAVLLLVLVPWKMAGEWIWKTICRLFRRCQIWKR